MNKSPKTNVELTGRRCQCPTCGECFSSEYAFDKHRAGPYGAQRHCTDPEVVGMVIRSCRKGTYWTVPSSRFA